MRLRFAIALLAVLVLGSCSGDTETDNTPGGVAGSTADVDVCALLTDAEISAVLGSVPPSEPTEPAGPFTGCAWGSGLLYVQIAPATTLITAPTETDCPSAGIGDESTMCSGSVKFLTNGIHTTISTIEDVSESQMAAVAATLLPKLQD